MACAAAACGGLALGSLPLAPLAVGLVLCGLLLLAWWAGSGGPAANEEAPPPAAHTAHTAQSAQLLGAVLPVWQRGVEAARLESERGLASLLEGYTGVAARVERAGSHAAVDMGGADKGSADELEMMLVGLQSQDRLSQMLVSTTDDMGRCMRWLQGADDPAAAQPEVWLERLHASLTMDEMRAAHHDTATVERGAAFELF
jgi:methyl-accepting chemotaxis protein